MQNLAKNIGMVQEGIRRKHLYLEGKRTDLMEYGILTERIYEHIILKPLIVCHDAGAAEVISSYVRRYKVRARFVLEGPAINIFERKLRKLS